MKRNKVGAVDLLQLFSLQYIDIDAVTYIDIDEGAYLQELVKFRGCFYN